MDHASSVAEFRAKVARARELPVVVDIVQTALERVQTAEPLLRKAFDESRIFWHMYEVWVCGTSLQSAVDIASRVAGMIADEVQAYKCALSTNCVAPAFFRFAELFRTSRQYCRSTPLEIITRARAAMQVIIDDQCPLGTQLEFWPALREALVHVEFPVERVDQHAQGGYVARILIYAFVHIAWDLCNKHRGFDECREQLMCIWEPHERALAALCPPNASE